jgi:hypothetical protein
MERSKPMATGRMRRAAFCCYPFALKIIPFLKETEMKREEFSE